MDLMDIVVSGPLAQRTQVMLILKGMSEHVYSHQHHWHLDGVTPDPTQGYVTCRAVDIDAIHQAVAQLGWRLRAHWHYKPPPPADPMTAFGNRIAILEARIKELEGRQ